MDSDDQAFEGPIPWRPVGTLRPVPNSPGEWHEIPLDGMDHQMSSDCTQCRPVLRVATHDGQLRSVWVHTANG